MTKNINYIINYSEGHLSKRKRQKFEKDLQINNELQQDYLVYRQINEYMRGKFDLEEVRNDPVLQDIDPVVKETISEYHQNPEKHKDAQKFINDTLQERILDLDLKEEINQIKREIHEHDLNEISEGWVKEWLEKNQDSNTKDPNIEKIRNFIIKSLEPEKNSSELKIVHKGKDAWRKSALIRIAGLSAAALIAGVVLFRILIPSENPEKLYEAFYEPMNAVSPVTRGNNSNVSEQYTEAIEMYNQGNYQVAASMFYDIMQKDTSFIASHFFQGITQLELGDYFQAISHLSVVAAHSREYMKEAQWYLGLSYLRTGEKTKAIPYFEILSASEGFYQDRAKKLLRLLK